MTRDDPAWGLDTVGPTRARMRLAAAEYRCCSSGSYALVVNGTGLRLEVRMPADAAGTLAAVGLPDGLTPGGVRPARSPGRALQDAR